MISLTKIFFIQIKEIVFVLRLKQELENKNSEIKFLSANLSNLEIKQIYSKNEKFIVSIHVLSGSAKLFPNSQIQEYKGSIFLLNTSNFFLIHRYST